MGEVKRKILLLSAGDVNGAYEAIYRLGLLFEEEGHQVSMLVKSKTQSKDFIIPYKIPYQHYKKKSIWLRIFNKIESKIKVKPKAQTTSILFDPNYDFISIDETNTNVDSEQIIKLIGFVPEFIYTGMTTGFMNSTDLLNLQQLTNAQVYNITVDMNHFTGGCHFAWDCKGYINGCDTYCPAVLSPVGKKIPKINFETKLKNAQLGNFKIIAGSGWTLKQAKESKIYKNQMSVLNINGLIDTKLFNTKNKDISKRVFDLDKNKFYILMGCQDANSKRKGFEYLLESLQILANNLTESQKNRLEVLIVSRGKINSFDQIPFPKRHIDYVKDYRLLALLYQAIDVFVNPSIEDSGPLMICEALGCGTPVVGFDMGVVNNMVVTGYNGYKAILKDSNDLAKGIQTIFELSIEEYITYSNNAVKMVEDFSSLDYAKSIFESIHQNS
ncbi:glycosyltransferase [Flavobacterium sp.]|uniref:glycosyltransferase n=1 Tax=Flavobacterium sp. TaxID=239 RepID=UPI002B4B5E24|nr:glycosyltransferase [Flavobacterium sp.]HLF51212.1 glycosyltransferase [Flavobacterium sp.]